jgi:hypothetical protein
VLLNIGITDLELDVRRRVTPHDSRLGTEEMSTYDLATVLKLARDLEERLNRILDYLPGP